MLFCVHALRFKIIITCSLSFLCIGVASANPEQTSEHDSDWRSSVTQVLAYKNDTLLNQGSGVVVADGGVVATSAHLLVNADRIVVMDSAGGEYEAVLVGQDGPADIALLRSGADLSALVFSQKGIQAPVRLQLSGYWHSTQEPPRRSLFGSSKRPKFVATPAENQTVEAFVNESDASDEYLKLLASVGRGAYGAPLINRCGQLQGLVRPNPNKTLKDLWQPHTPLGVFTVRLARLEALMKNGSVAPAKASTPCLSVAEEQKAAEKAKQQALDKAKQKAREAEEKARKAEESAKQAKEEAESEKQAREDAEKDRQDITAIAENINEQAEQTVSENAEIKEENQLLFWGVVAAVGVGLIVALLLIFKRKSDLSVADKALQAASARFHDCRFEGTNSAGSPIAFMVLGKDLMQRDQGLIVGRNPDMSQVVIADDTVSRQHAQLFVKDNYLYVKDLGSTGGTRINGVAVTEQGAAMISGDKVEFGDCRLTITVLEGA